jgi:hypothetical protein
VLDEDNLKMGSIADKESKSGSESYYDEEEEKEEEKRPNLRSVEALEARLKKHAKA